MRSTYVRRLVALAALSLLPAAARAQCPVSTDPEYGLSPQTAVPLGGGSLVEQGQREGRYINNLRGPGGETPTLQRRGSQSLPDAANNRRVLLDSYTVTLPSRTVTVYLNFTDSGTPQLPAGFTCAVPLAFALEAGTPPIVDGAITIRQTWDFVPQHYQTRQLAPVSLDADGTSTHGVVFDNFRMLFLRARAANGQIPPLPPNVNTATPLTVVVFPRDCNGSAVAAESIEIVYAEGKPLPRVGGLGRVDQLAKSLPGAKFPDNSMGALFSAGGPSLRAGDTVRIRYAASACTTENEVILPVRFEPARLTSSPPPLVPPAFAEVEWTVFVQALVDVEGRFEQPAVLSGPESLRAAAIDAIKKWTVTPARVNGSPVFSFSTLRVTFVSK